MDKILEKMIVAAKAGGEELLKFFGGTGGTFEISQKTGPNDLCTDADLASEKVIMDYLQKHFPEYNIYSEEAGKIDKGSDFTFVVDPLDGTNNFVLGIPYFCVIIGLEKNKDVLATVIYNPILDQVYSAIKGQGSFFQDKKLQVNSESDIKKSTIAFYAAYTIKPDRANAIRGLIQARPAKRLLTNWTVLDFCVLARGKIEGIVSNDMEYHDILIASFFAKEAGAKITDFSGDIKKGSDLTQAIISNGTKLHDNLVEMMSQFKNN
ncbi:inositol monophosphatase [Candidatus Falkowbacteria bacterium]|nr:inositol monophosphatase [Candidatus Falkowbacteria bacterium]